MESWCRSPKVIRRKKNPVFPSSKNERVKKAANLYREFTGHEPEYIDDIETAPIEIGAKFGVLDGVLYTTVRDGVRESYIHEFKRGCKPDLVADYDGEQIQIVGGKYRFTDRGIVDG